MFFKKSNYRRSKSISEVDFDISSHARKLANKILKSKNLDNRQRLSDELLDELADLAQINIAKLKISDAKQYHKKYNGRTVFKQYGYYRPASKYIYINNRTAVRGQIIASKTFLNTLVHEWMHHYDHEKLGLNSIHTSGFYERLNSLQAELLTD